MSCRKCDLYKNCESVKMLGDGSRKAEIMLVGNHPNKMQDERTYLPFSSDPGDKLDYLIRRAKIKRSNLYLTNIIKCYPGTKNPKKENINACIGFLEKEIIRVKPKVLVLVGKHALRPFLGVDSIRDVRGEFHDYSITYRKKGENKKRRFKTKIYVTYSPSAALGKWEQDDVIIHDFKKIKNYLKTGEAPKVPDLDWKPILNLKDLNKLKKTLLASKQFAFDFETSGKNFVKDKIICATFSNKEGKAWAVPCLEYTDKLFEQYGFKKTKKVNSYLETLDDENRKIIEKTNKFVTKYKSEIRNFFREVFSSDVSKIAQNGKFDIKFARAARHPVKPKTYKFDTIIAHSLLDENKPHALTFLLEWFGINYGVYEKELWPYVGKDKKKSYIFIPPLLLWEYGCKDADGTLRLKKILLKMLKKEPDLLKLFKKQQMPLVLTMSDIEYRGMKMDINMLKNLSKDFQYEITRIDKACKKLAGDKELNPGSPAQLAKAFERLKAPVVKKTPSGTMSTNETCLNQWVKKGNRKKVQKLAENIINLRTVQGLKSKYLDGADGDSGVLKWVDKNNLVHYSSNIHTPRTGRLSISDPPIQQIPRPNPKFNINLRKMFIPSNPDWLLCSADFAQLEMRIAAFLSRDMTMIKEIRNKVDIHSRNIVMFGTTLGLLPEDITEKKFIRIMDYEAPKGWKKLSKEERKKIKKRIKKAAEYTELRVLAKTIGFGLAYGKTAYSIAKEFGIDVDQVESMIEMYFEKYHGLNDWREKQKEDWMIKRVSVLPETKRRRRFTCARWFNSSYSGDYFKRKTDIEAVDRQAMNFPIQGYANEIYTSGADFKGGKIRLHKVLKKKRMESGITLTMHDGILIDTKPSEAKKVKAMCLKYLPKVLGKGTKYEVPLDVDIEFYDRWSGEKVKLCA